MSLTARLQLDRFDRVSLDRAGTLRDVARQPLDVVVDNISSTGCLVSTDADLPNDTLVTIGIAGLGTRSARVVRQETSGYGLAFLEPASEGEIRAAHSAETLVRGPFVASVTTSRAQFAAPSPVITDERLPYRTRVQIIVGTSLALWALIGFGVTAFLSA